MPLSAWSGEQTVMEGCLPTFGVFEPLDFLAEVSQHIPNSGKEMLIRHRVDNPRRSLSLVTLSTTRRSDLDAPKMRHALTAGEPEPVGPDGPELLRGRDRGCASNCRVCRPALRKPYPGSRNR